MARLKPSERMRLAYLSADRMRRTAISRVLSSPPFRWQFAAAADQLLIVPQDLRTADPSFWDEVELGQFGLAGSVAVIEEGSPFDVAPPNDAWARALHGFEWLRNLEAAGRPEAREAARVLATQWAMRHRGGGTGIAWEPAVAGRRLISWLSHSSLLLEGADARSYDAITMSLAIQLIRLSAGWRDSPSGYPRLLALIALVLADLSIAGHEHHLSEIEGTFGAELARQILPDGGHVSRNPGVLVELMLDLLPLRQCFAARGRMPPAQVLPAMQRMLSMLKFMRMGDGMLARFNGMGVASPAGLATVLAYDDEPGVVPTMAGPSRYVRLARGNAIVLMDAGTPPPLESAGEAHAGCLSFELSSGTRLVFVNGGAPGAAESDWRAASRATASHNTLCLGEKSSSKLIRHSRLEELVGSHPIRHPDRVHFETARHGDAVEVHALHDGYMRRFGLIHRRTLALSGNGRRLLGIDRLESPRNARFKQDVPFAIHFHLHPHAMCRVVGDGNAAEIVLAGGEVWWFTLEGARLSIEESTYFADSAGPRGALQIVARGATYGESEVRWVVEVRGAVVSA